MIISEEEFDEFEDADDEVFDPNVGDFEDNNGKIDETIEMGIKRAIGDKSLRQFRHTADK